MRPFIWIILVSSVISSCAAGQNAYYFQSWRSMYPFSSRLVVFQIDTSGTEEDTRPCLLAVDRIGTYLDSLQIEYDIIPYPSDTVISEAIPIFRFERLEDAYVKMNTVQRKVPTSYRMTITEVNSGGRRQIQTLAAISIPEFRKGLMQFGKAFAL